MISDKSKRISEMRDKKRTKQNVDKSINEIKLKDIIIITDQRGRNESHVI